MINRLKNNFNVIDPSSIMSPKDSIYKNVNYYTDSRSSDIADKGDSFTTSSYTNWVDQMILYANMRKTSGKKESYSLDSVSNDELGKSKLEFNEDETIRNLPWKDFKKFFKYNVKDVFLLYLIEQKVGDIDILNMLAMLTRTRIDKATRKTISLRNLAHDFHRQNNLVLSNNRNLTYGGESKGSESFRGAYVSNPLLNAAVGLLINGKRSKFVFRNVIDVDLSSLYPSIIIAFNIDKSTQIGKVVMFDPKTKENAAPEFMDSIQSQDWASVGPKYFKLPDMEEMLNGFDDYLKEVA